MVAFDRMAAHGFAYGLFVGLLLLGLMFYLWAFVVLVFRGEPGAADIFALFGTGSWALGMAVFFFFLCEPEPRHSKRR